MQDLETITERIGKSTLTFINQIELDKNIDNETFNELLLINIFIILNPSVYNLDDFQTDDSELVNLKFDSENLNIINEFIFVNKMELTPLAKLYVYLVTKKTEEQIVYLTYIKEVCKNQKITYKLLLNETFAKGLIPKKTLETIINEI